MESKEYFYPVVWVEHLIPGLFAAGFSRWNRGQVRGQVVGLEGLDQEAEQAVGWHAKINGAARAVDRHSHAYNGGGMQANDVDGFLHPPAFGHYILNHEESFVWSDSEAAAQGQLSVFLLNKDEPQPKLAGNFLA
jgi:hypothetical protein